MIFPAPGRRTKQRSGAIVLFLLLGALLVGAVAMFLAEGGVMPVVAMVLLAVALYGLVRSTLPSFRADPEGGYGPVLVVNQDGIGDGRLFLPWSRVTDVRVAEIRSTRRARTLGARLNDAIAADTGVLDGEFELHIHTTTPVPPQALVPGRHSQPHPQLIIYNLQRDIPSAHWTPLADAIRAYARQQGITTD